MAPCMAMGTLYPLLSRAHLPGIPPPHEGEFCLAFLSFARSLSEHPETSDLIVSTPWFWYILGRTWIHLPTNLIPAKRILAIDDLHSFIIAERATDPANMEELVEGAGGTVSDLAALVVAFIHNTIPVKDTAMDDTYIYFLRSLLISMGRVDPAIEVRFKGVKYLGEFGKALLSQKIIRALVKAICSINRSGTSAAEIGLHDCFDLLGSLFFSARGYGDIAAAIDAGLLRALIMSAQCSLAQGLHGRFQLYFDILLTPTLIHHCVLSAVQRAIHGLTHLIHTAAFKQCATYKVWAKFHLAANRRLEVLAAFDSNMHSEHVKACDNLQCPKLDVKTAFRWCSGCQSIYYCSEACQLADGGHREACNSYAKLFWNSKNDEEFTARQCSFLRALVHHDYQKAQATLLPAQKFYPNGFLTMYNYTEGTPRIDIQSVTALAITQGFDGVEWKNILSCAAAGGGKLGIHGVQIYVPKLEGMRYFVVN
ncbi:hypothetical protein K438DRAFT_1836476 [Mycena galopus ATCC 62051]|nr:hypothetical protein K438DRAFT_1836476 [Mycena galopus ATCC 62051]